jgi:hypothetical protein
MHLDVRLLQVPGKAERRPPQAFMPQTFPSPWALWWLVVGFETLGVAAALQESVYVCNMSISMYKSVPVVPHATWDP